MSADKKSLSLARKLASLRDNYQRPNSNSGNMRDNESKVATDHGQNNNAFSYFFRTGYGTVKS